MTATAHIIRKDFRRFGVMLALWAALFAIHMAIEWLMAKGMNSTAAALGPIVFFGGLCELAFWILTVVIAVQLIQEDLPGGTTAFWLTRPFRRRDVIEAKLAWIIVLGVLPALVETAAIATLGVSFQVLAVIFALECAKFGLAALCAMAFAVTSESLGQTVVTAVLVLIGTMAVMSFLGILMALNRAAVGRTPQMFTAVDHGVAATGSVVTQALALALSAGIVIIAYRWRLRAARVLVSAASLLVAFVGAHWAWDWTGSRQPSGNSAPVSVQFSGRLLRGGLGEQVAMDIRGTSSNSDYFVEPIRTSHVRLILADGSQVETSPVTAQDGFVDGYAIARHLGGFRLQSTGHQRGFRFAYRLRDVEGMDLAHARLSADVDADMYAVEEIAELPLMENAHNHDARHRIGVRDVSSTPGEVDVDVREGEPTSPLLTPVGSYGSDITYETHVTYVAGQKAAVPELPAFVHGTFGQRPMYALLNRSRGEIMFAAADLPQKSESFFGQYHINNHTLRFMGRGLDQDWLRDAKLIAIKFSYAGPAEGTVDADAGGGASEPF